MEVGDQKGRRRADCGFSKLRGRIKRIQERIDQTTLINIHPPNSYHVIGTSAFVASVSRCNVGTPLLSYYGSRKIFAQAVNAITPQIRPPPASALTAPAQAAASP